jgi:hypothetical protein
VPTLQNCWRAEPAVDHSCVLFQQIALAAAAPQCRLLLWHLLLDVMPLQPSGADSLLQAPEVADIRHLGYQAPSSS